MQMKRQDYTELESYCKPMSCLRLTALPETVSGPKGDTQTDPLPGARKDDRDRQLVVRAPNGRVLSPIGEEVPDTQFWNRRLRDGDVVAAEPIVMPEGVRHVGADGQAVELASAEAAAEHGVDPATAPMARECQRDIRMSPRCAT